MQHSSAGHDTADMRACLTWIELRAIDYAVSHLDKLINVTNGGYVVWNEWLERSLQLRHLWLVLQDVLKQVLHLLTDRQLLIIVWVIAACISRIVRGPGQQNAPIQNTLCVLHTMVRGEWAVMYRFV